MDLVAAPWRVGEVPVQHRGQVLQAGIDGWQPSMHKGMTTSKMALLLRQGLGVSFVASEIQKYKDAVLFGLTMAWGVEIPPPPPLQSPTPTRETVTSMFF